MTTWFNPHCDLPKLMMLGPLTVRVAPTGKPAAAAGRRPYFTELLAYLATRPYGATTEEVADAMRIPTDRVRKDILALRTWLGTQPPHRPTPHPRQPPHPGRTTPRQAPPTNSKTCSSTPTCSAASAPAAKPADPPDSTTSAAH